MKKVLSLLVIAFAATVFTPAVEAGISTSTSQHSLGVPAAKKAKKHKKASHKKHKKVRTSSATAPKAA